MKNLTSKFQYKPPSKKRKRGQQCTGKKQLEKGGDKAGKAVKAMMFVPYTAHSGLAMRMRENEEKMEKKTGYRLKIVEKGGTKLIDLLHKANPWAGQDCSRDRCMLCISKNGEDKRNTQDCKKRNCMYETNCWTCTQRQDKIIEEKYKEQGQRKIEVRRVEQGYIKFQFTSPRGLV
jgi:hypothetical protein